MSTLIRTRAITDVVPPEIVDMCISLLAHSRSDLLACRLSCKAFTNASRYHLFPEGKIVLDQRTLPLFLNTMRSPLASSVGLAPVITEITLSCPHAVSSLEDPQQSTALELTAQLAGVVSLRLSSMTTCDRFVPDLSRLLRVLPNVQVLDLFDVKFESTVHLVDFICAFPELHTLSLRLCTTKWQETVDTPTKQLSKAINLQHVDLCGLHEPIHFVKWMMSQKEEGHLSTCRLVCGTQHLPSGNATVIEAKQIVFGEECWKVQAKTYAWCPSRPQRILYSNMGGMCGPLTWTPPLVTAH